MTAIIALITELLFLSRFSDCQKANVYIGTRASGSLSTTGENDNDKVVLGGLFPVHEAKDDRCGAILDLGIQTLEAMVLATQMINDDASLLPRVTMVFEIRDTCALENMALEQSLDFIIQRNLSIGQDVENGTILGISGVVGAALSKVSTSVATLLRLFQIPQISYASTAPSLSDKLAYKYFFRTVPSDSLQAKAMVDIIEHFNWTYVITMHTGDIYGREGIRAFMDEFENRNSTQKCIATSSSVELSTNAKGEEFDRAIEIINQNWIRNASVVVLFVQQATAIGILDAVRRKQEIDLEFASKHFTWIGSDGWGVAIPRKFYEIARGSLSIVHNSPPSPLFDKYFQSLHPLNYSTNPWFTKYWESVFNCTLGGRHRLKDDCNTATQRLSSENGYRQNSYVAFTMNVVYAFAHAKHNMQQDLCSGGPGLCENMSEITLGGVTIQREKLFSYLHKVSFSSYGSDGVITFDDNGDYQQGGFIIKNLKCTEDGEFIFDTVGYWDEVPSNRVEQLEIFGEIEWSQDLGYSEVPQSFCSQPCESGEYQIPIINQVACCWECRPCLGTNTVSSGLACIECERGYIPNEGKSECIAIEPSYLKWTHWWSYVIIVLTSFGVTACTTVIVLFIVYHKHQLTKASSRELSTVLLTGIMLCYLLPFFFIMKPSPWTCAVRRFGVGFAFSLCYSALLVKTNRIHRIFNRSPTSLQSPPFVSPLSQLFFTTLLVSVQIILAIVWLTVKRPSVAYIYYKSSVELVCGESPVIRQLITLGYNFFLLLGTVYFAFRARKVPQNFNEAKFINLTVYSLFILWLAFISTYYATASLGTLYQTGSLMIAIIVNATVTLCTLFVPKIYFLYSQLHKDHDSPVDSGSNRRYSNSRDQRLPSCISLRIAPSNRIVAKPLVKSVSNPAMVYRLEEHNACQRVMATQPSTNDEPFQRHVVECSTRTCESD